MSSGDSNLFSGFLESSSGAGVSFPLVTSVNVGGILGSIFASFVAGTLAGIAQIPAATADAVQMLVGAWTSFILGIGDPFLKGADRLLFGGDVQRAHQPGLLDVTIGRAGVVLGQLWTTGLDEFGILAYPIAVATALGMTYIFAWGANEIREEVPP